jgi:arylformamidase
MNGYRRLCDISVLIDASLPVYPGDPSPAVRSELSTASGDEANVSSLSIGTHVGTHVDAPYHVDAAWPTLQEVDLMTLIGPVRVVDCTLLDHIDVEQLERLAWEDITRVLFKTRNSVLWRGGQIHDPVYLTDGAASFLVEKTGVRLVGIDGLSVESGTSSGLPVHRTLLGRGVLIVEGLDLAAVKAGDYFLLCLPLLTAARDGAPARAVLLAP